MYHVYISINMHYVYIYTHIMNMHYIYTDYTSISFIYLRRWMKEAQLPSMDVCSQAMSSHTSKDAPWDIHRGWKTWWKCKAHCNALQHTATYCNTLRHTATHCNMLQHTATRCNTLQPAATRCNTLQHAASRCKMLQHTATHCSTL